MDLIKKVALVALIVCVAGFAQADFLYWHVDTGADDAYSAVDMSAVAGATLYKFKTDTNPSRPYEGAEGASGYVTVADGKTGVQSYELNNSDTGYSFFVELYNEEGTVVWTQYASTYDQLVASQAIATSGIGTPAALASGGMNGASVPEPTSGIMLLIGGAVLALRRRRA